jgi:hypothetical protein
MKINAFVEAYKENTLLGDPISIGTTALRNYIKEHKIELEKEKLVKFTKKLSSLSIEITDPDGLYRKIS